ncbi:MAG TPA: protein kinase, partial [Polyangiaceae bacterium]|nr:protein kinase [Polyangiaceae bacterium]
MKARHGLPDSISEGLFVYRALSELDADGAWGTWLGEQREASGVTQPVLLKLTGESNRTRAGADMLWLEALLSLKLDGPQVTPLLDYGVLDGRPFAVYGFEEGVFLAQIIEGLRERGRRLPSGVAVGIILQACELIKRLHKLSLADEAPSGFVHGSLCPRNIMLTERGDVKILGLVNVRPIGRVVGREHVPAAAVAYAAPDLLGGAPVTPAVDVHSLGAVLQELVGDGSGDSERDELAVIVRAMLQQGPSGGFSTVDAFAGALQDAVRRTGTVVARQSISAQVRGVCEQYLLERRRQVRALRETEWVEQREGSNGRAGAPAATARSGASPSADELELQAAAEEESAGLSEYDEESSDDAVTRIYDGELEAESAGQPQAWMHDSAPPEAARPGWSRWAVVTLLGVLVAVASGAAVMAGRSVAKTPAPEARVAAAAPEREREVAPVVAKVAAAAPPAAEPAAAGAGDLAAVRGQEADEPEPAAAAVNEAATADDARDSEARGPRARRPMLRRVAATPRRGRMASSAREAAEARPAAATRAPEAEPATVDVRDLPEAREEPQPERAAPTPAPAPSPKPAAQGDSDLVIEEAPKVAYLSIDATPYATVFIDGEKKGITPLVRLELVPGLHRMIARTEDGRTKRYTLQLDPGKTE